METHLSSEIRKEGGKFSSLAKQKTGFILGFVCVCACVCVCVCVLCCVGGDETQTFYMLDK
jgi:hypothetical protein